MDLKGEKVYWKWSPDMKYTARPLSFRNVIALPFVRLCVSLAGGTFLIVCAGLVLGGVWSYTRDERAHGTKIDLVTPSDASPQTPTSFQSDSTETQKEIPQRQVQPSPSGVNIPQREVVPSQQLPMQQERNLNGEKQVQPPGIDIPQGEVFPSQQLPVQQEPNLNGEKQMPPGIDIPQREVFPSQRLPFSQLR